VKTRNSTYSVALRLTGKRVGALRGTSSRGGNIDVRDTDPTVGGSSVFEVPVDEWTGKALDFAGITTSPVVSIVPETDVALIAEVTSPGGGLVPAKRSAPRATRVEPREEKKAAREGPPYPMSYLEYAEHAQTLLSIVARDGNAIRGIAEAPTALVRLRLAVAGAVAMANAIADQIERERA
jgi:hypothetical protein